MDPVALVQDGITKLGTVVGAVVAFAALAIVAYKGISALRKAG